MSGRIQRNWISSVRDPFVTYLRKCVNLQNSVHGGSKFHGASYFLSSFPISVYIAGLIVVLLVFKRDQTAQNVNQLYESSVHTAVRCNRARLTAANDEFGGTLKTTVVGIVPKFVFRN